MKILKPPTDNKYNTIYTMYCPHCGALLEFGGAEVQVTGTNEYVYCPCCNKLVDVKPVSIDLGMEESEPPHFKFPDSFYHFGESSQAVYIPEDEVQQMVDRMVKKFPELKPGEFDIEATGDTMVLALKFEDSNEVVVAKNYWEDEFITEE